MESGHLEAILTKIRGLINDFVPDKVLNGSHFYGPNHHANQDDILAAVLPRPVADRLMALHFGSYIIAPCKRDLDSVYRSNVFIIVQFFFIIPSFSER